MANLTEIFPDPDLLLVLAPEDLAPVVLSLAKDALQNGIVHPQAIFQQVHGPNNDHSKGYAQNKKQAAETALNHAWNWLQRNGLVIPQAGMNGNNGWHELTPQGAKIAADGNFESFKQAATFPKALLHPAIADRVWLCLARGEYDTAVFESLRTIEICVRTAGKFAMTDLGVELMRKAFDPANGQLTNQQEPQPERLALSHLFAGAIGYYKNSQSHRSVNVDAAAAREVAVLASHLLRIVDERTPKN